MFDIRKASVPAEFDDVCLLMRAYLLWQKAYNSSDREMLDLYFNAAAYEAEIAHLPERYAAADSCLLVAYANGGAVGCVAMHPLGAGVCEMKRLFVTSSEQGHGTGRALAMRLMAEARLLGYHTMRLDTGHKQVGAIHLYESLNFKRIAPYYDMPKRLADWLVFFECDLKAHEQVRVQCAILADSTRRAITAH